LRSLTPALRYGLIWREDLARMQDIKSGVLARPKPTSAEARFLASTGGVEGAGAAEGEEEAGEDKDGLELVDKFSSMLFPNDHRVKEVGRLLRSSQPLFLKVERAPEVSDHEHEQRKQTKLMHLCNRNMAVPIGRGMLTLGTLVTPLLAEALPIPELCLAGKVPPSNAIMKLDTTACDAMMKAWPEFHNGVAAGLRLGSAATTKGVSRTWIVYNKVRGRRGWATQANCFAATASLPLLRSPFLFHSRRPPRRRLPTRTSPTRRRTPPLPTTRTAAFSWPWASGGTLARSP
jgi:anaphase-promoting complex subunit 1